MYDINSIISSTGEHGYLWVLTITILVVSIANLLMIFVRAFIGTDKIILNQKETNTLLKEIQDTLREIKKR